MHVMNVLWGGGGGRNDNSICFILKKIVYLLCNHDNLLLLAARNVYPERNRVHFSHQRQWHVDIEQADVVQSNQLVNPKLPKVASTCHQQRTQESVYVCNSASNLCTWTHPCSSISACRHRAHSCLLADTEYILVDIGINGISVQHDEFMCVCVCMCVCRWLSIAATNKRQGEQSWQRSRLSWMTCTRNRQKKMYASSQLDQDSVCLLHLSVCACCMAKV